MLPVIIFDLAFLPMFHIYGLPVKPSYLLIPLFFVSHTNLGFGVLAPRGLGKDLTLLFFLLAAATLLGVAVFEVIYEGSSTGESMRNIIILMMAPLAFMAGARDIRRKHNYLAFYLFGYAAFTLVFSIYYVDLGFIAKFYGLEERIASGVYADRSQGLFLNANVSALFMTLLFLNRALT